MRHPRLKSDIKRHNLLPCWLNLNKCSLCTCAYFFTVSFHRWMTFRLCNKMFEPKNNIYMLHWIDCNTKAGCPATISRSKSNNKNLMFSWWSLGLWKLKVQIKHWVSTLLRVVCFSVTWSFCSNFSQGKVFLSTLSLRAIVQKPCLSPPLLRSWILFWEGFHMIVPRGQVVP